MALFEAHAATYDRINTVITFGQDARWRRWAAGEAVRRGAAVATARAATAARAPATAARAPATAAASSPRAPRLLDACAGTGLVGLAAAELGAQVTLADASPLMLARARARAAAQRLAVDDVVVDLAALSPPAATRATSPQPDPSQLDSPLPGAPPGVETPLAPASFDAVTLAFGLRYLPDPAATLRALAAMLRPGGVVVALEAVVPTASSATTTTAPGPDAVTTPAPGAAATRVAAATTARVRTAAARTATTIAALYFFWVAPRIGALLAGRRDLYERLTGSVRDLGDGDDLAGLFADAGLTVVSRRAWVCGLVVGVVAERPQVEASAAPPVEGRVGERPAAPVGTEVDQPSSAPAAGVPDRQSRGSAPATSSPVPRAMKEGYGVPLLRLDEDPDQLVLHSQGAVCASTREVIESEPFERVVGLYLDHLAEHDGPLLEALAIEPADAAARASLVDLLRLLAHNPLERVARTSFEWSPLLERRAALHRFVEGLYDFWRGFDRFLVDHAGAGRVGPGDGVDRVFNTSLETLAELIRDLYRDVAENVTRTHPHVYRQVHAGAELGAVVGPRRWPVPDAYRAQLKTSPSCAACSCIRRSSSTRRPRRAPAASPR